MRIDVFAARWRTYENGSVLYQALFPASRSLILQVTKPSGSINPEPDGNFTRQGYGTDYSGPYIVPCTPWWC